VTEIPLHFCSFRLDGSDKEDPKTERIGNVGGLTVVVEVDDGGEVARRGPARPLPQYFLTRTGVT
jgi:hypothetical protein